MIPNFRQNLPLLLTGLISAILTVTTLAEDSLNITQLQDDNNNTTTTTSEQDPHQTDGISVGTAKMIGFLLAICGNTLIACSLTLQKSAHNSLNSTDSTSATSPSQPQTLDNFDDDDHDNLNLNNNDDSVLNKPHDIRHSDLSNIINDKKTANNFPGHRDSNSVSLDISHHPSSHPQTKSSKELTSTFDQQPHPHTNGYVTAAAQLSNQSHENPTLPHDRYSRSSINKNSLNKSSANRTASSSVTSTPSSTSIGDLEEGPMGPSQGSGFAFLHNPTWWMGTFLMAAGEIGNFMAFGFAPASLVAPLGAWSVVLSAILAHVFLHEAISNTNIIGISLCVTGAFLIGTSGPDVSNIEATLDANKVSELLIRIPFIIFMLLTLTATAGLIYVSHRTTLGERFIFVYVGVSSLLGGVTVVCAKALSTFMRLTIEGNSQFSNWLPFALGVILALAILAQLRYLNMAMSQFGNAQVIPVYYVLFTSCAMTSGVIMYREFDQLTARNLPFFVGICSTMTGVFLVSKSARNTGNSSSAGAGVHNVHSNMGSDQHHHVHHHHYHHHTNTSTTKRAIKNGSQNGGQVRYDRLPVSPVSSPRQGTQPSMWS